MAMNSRTVAPNVENPEEWLRYACSDLKIATTAHVPGIRLEGLCFHAQQAAEKALKAVLVRHEVPVRRTCDLRVILRLVRRSEPVPKEIEESAWLTPFAVSGMYPVNPERVDEQTYRRAIRSATAVVRWAERLIR
jgi:HEPN domain-containing protein